MSQYNTYPGVDENYEFPPAVRQAAANSVENKASIGVEIETKVEPLVDEYIGSNPSVVAAAAAAVDANPRIKVIEGDVQSIESTMVTAQMNLGDTLKIDDELGNNIITINEISSEHPYIGNSPTPYTDQNVEDSFIVVDDAGMVIFAVDDLHGSPHIRGGKTSGWRETHFIILAGQSNSMGIGTPQPQGSNDPLPNLFVIPQRGNSEGTEKIAVEPLQHPYSTAYAGSIGHGWTVARDYALNRPDVRVVIIPLAMSGSGFFHSASTNYSWAPSRVGEPGIFSLYTEAILRSNKAINQYSGVRKVAMVIWHQGEADAVGNTTQTQYETELTSLINGFRSEIYGAAEAPVIVGQLGWEFRNVRMPGTYEQIDLAHKNMPNLVSGVAFAEAPPQGYMFEDNTHFRGHGQKLLAKNMIEQVENAMYNV